MAHVHALGDACPKARPIIHLGMTSQDVVCNADLTTVSAAARVIERKVARAVISLGALADRTRLVPALGFTHYQPAQPVTVGRRVAGWASDLVTSCQLERSRYSRVRGLRGATGTQASFMALLGDDGDAIDWLEEKLLHRLFEMQSPELGACKSLG
jgi:adenylosuccinate lyase